jgi:hypothetical protein
MFSRPTSSGHAVYLADELQTPDQLMQAIERVDHAPRLSRDGPLVMKRLYIIGLSSGMAQIPEYAQASWKFCNRDD